MTKRARGKRELVGQGGEFRQPCPPRCGAGTTRAWGAGVKSITPAAGSSLAQQHVHAGRHVALVDVADRAGRLADLLDHRGGVFHLAGWRDVAPDRVGANREVVLDVALGRLWRDAKLHEIGAGTSEIRRMLIGRELFVETA